jgi:hypothetical protein
MKESPPIKRWTGHEYDRLVECGVFGPADRIDPVAERLMKKAHLLRWRPRPHPRLHPQHASGMLTVDQSSREAPRVRPSGAASYLDLLDQPAGWSAGT